MADLLGGRKLIHERYDLIPPLAKRWMARVMAYGWYKRNGQSTWNEYQTHGDHSPINHAEGHLTKAQGIREGEPERIWQLAKAMVNIAMQITLESSRIPETKMTEWYNKVKAEPAYKQMELETKNH